MRALILATTGRYVGNAFRELSRRGMIGATNDIRFDEPESNTRQSLNRVWGWPPGSPPGPDYLGLPSLRYPWQLCFHNLLAWAPSAGENMSFHPAIVVCGDSMDDFALYWTLRSLRARPPQTNVFWVPHVDDAGAAATPGYERVLPILADSLWRYLDRFPLPDPQVLVTSSSVSPERLTDVGALLVAASTAFEGLGSQDLGAEGWSLDEAAATAQSSTGWAEVVSPDDAGRLVPYITEFWEQDNDPYSNAYVAQFLGGTVVGRQPAPEPRHALANLDGSPQWVVEAKLAGVRIPRRSGLEDLLADPASGEDFRVCRDGLAYTVVRADKPPGAPRRAGLVEPTFRLPDDLKVFEAVCRREGLSLAPSDKGRYERILVEKLGGLEATGRELRDERSVRVLLDYVSGKENRPGVRDEGITIRRRRYLDLSSLAKLCGGPEQANAFADRYLERGLLERGSIIKCTLCRALDWYRPRELTDRFSCHRCGREQVYSADTGTYFRLDEPVLLAVEQNSYVSLLTLERLRGRSEKAFLYATGCELRRVGKEGDEDKPWAEIDFLALEYGDLVIGEAKRTGTLSPTDRQQLDKYVRICSILRPARFVATTAAPEWSDESAAFLGGIEDKLGRYEVALVRLTARDIGWPIA